MNARRFIYLTFLPNFSKLLSQTLNETPLVNKHMLSPKVVHTQNI